MLSLLCNAYSLVVLLSVVASWLSLPPEHPLARITRALTEPVLAPLRRVVPSFGGLDLSPMVLLFALRLLQRFVA
jgi:YggT family protein